MFGTILRDCTINEESYRSLEKARRHLYGEPSLEPALAEFRGIFSELEESLLLYERADARCLRARLLIHLARYGEAEAELTRGLELEPNHAGCLSFRGRLRLLRALSSRFSRGSEENPRGDLLTKKALGDFSRFPGESEKLEPVESAMTLAYYDFLWKESPATRERCDAGLSRFSDVPGCEEFHLVRGLTFSDEDRVRNALEALSQAIARRPNHYEAYFLRGLVHFENDNFFKAQEELQKAVEIHSGFGNGWMALGLTRIRLANPSQAEEDLTRAIDLNPADPESYLARGGLRMGRGQTNAAIEDYLKGIRYSGFEEAPCFAVASQTFASGAYGPSVDHLSAVLNLDPRLDAAILIRALASLHLCRYGQAETDFMRFLEREPGARTAVEPWLARCRRKE